ncbi:hypothetical protein BDZ97DRAFT_1821895 [Flammula alnicola]|nr:hypothetical protein BDZ97DRAFT_1821895 [Flammula alnicola]
MEFIYHHYVFWIEDQESTALINDQRRIVCIQAGLRTQALLLLAHSSEVLQNIFGK